MLTFAFFVSAFVSCSWLIYAFIYVKNALGETSFSALALPEAASYVALILLPVLVMWMIFGYIHQFFATKSINRKTLKLMQQMRKNQDYSDLMVRIMIDAEHEIKDGFILNKFDLFISDMNEMLADLLMRCNLVSSGQMENLWNRILHGERWSIAKILIANNPAGLNVADRIFEYAKRDQIIAGTLMEFCSRYQMLLSMLEKHDQDAVFLNIIQTGVMGKAYSILAPVSEQVQSGGNDAFEKPQISREQIVDKVIEEAKPQEAPKKSFFSSLKSTFSKKEEPHFSSQEKDEDEFFASLSSSGERTEKIEPSFSSSPFEEEAQNKPETEQSETEEIAYPFGGWTDEKNYK